jgi:hypothetical protein
VENARSSLAEKGGKAVSLMLRENLINLVKVVTEKEASNSLQRMRPEKNVVILMLRKHLINLAKYVKEK